jgi:hypothetical protein
MVTVPVFAGGHPLFGSYGSVRSPFPGELIDDGKELVATERLLQAWAVTKADREQRLGIASKEREGDSLSFKHFGKPQTNRSAP